MKITNRGPLAFTAVCAVTSTCPQAWAQEQAQFYQHTESAGASFELYRNAGLSHEWNGGASADGSPQVLVQIDDQLPPRALTTGQDVDSGQSKNEPGPNKRKDGTLEEIIVTAQKREQSLQDVPISIAVLGGDELDSSTVRDVTEALRSVPGVSINQSFLGGLAQVPIRGVAAGNVVDQGSSPTAYYLDSVPFGFVKHAFLPDADMYDLERVEVLRGPQGTLYGANALNGVVRVLSKDPNMDDVEFKVRGLTSSTKYGGWNYRADMGMNVPVVEDKLAARATFSYQDLSGWIDRPNTKDANDAKRLAMRLKLKAKPTDDLTVDLFAWLSRADYGAPDNGFDYRHSTALLDESSTTDYDVYGLNINYESPWFSAASVTGYLNYNSDYGIEVGPRGTGNGFALPGFLDAKTFAQELTLSSVPGGSWQWSAGGMYRRSEDLDFSTLPAILSTPLSDLRSTSNSYAVFGELTKILLDGQLELTAGLRYFEDDLTQVDGSFSSFTTDATFSATTPRFVLTWHPNEQMTVYASYSEGFRSGTNQFASILTVAPFPPVEPDTLANYELGAKGALVDGRLSFETALYYIDWQDVQQVLGVDITGDGIFQPAGVNGESASGIGFDLAVTAAPVDALKLGVNLSWNDLAMDADVFSGGFLLYEKGDRLNNSVEYTVGAAADYFFSLGRNGFEGQFSASANYASEQPRRSRVRRTDGAPIWIARTSVSIRAPDHWTVSLFVDNVNNERAAPQKDFNVPDFNRRVRPRTIGMQLEYEF